MDTSAGASALRPDWDGPAAPGGARGPAAAAALWVVLAGAGTAVVALVGGPPWAGAAAVVVVLAIDLASRGRRALSRARAEVVAPGSSPRLENLFEGLRARLGLPHVRLFRWPEPTPQAFVCRAGGVAVAVSDGLVEDFTRTELEAVLAHCLVRASGFNLRRAALACHLRWLAPATGTVVGPHEDVAAAAFTRYPPALASAIRKAAPAEGAPAPFHFVAHHPSHADPTARIELLGDL